jgi:hypothetical protein
MVSFSRCSDPFRQDWRPPDRRRVICANAKVTETCRPFPASRQVSGLVKKILRRIGHARRQRHLPSAAEQQILVGPAAVVSSRQRRCHGQAPLPSVGAVPLRALRPPMTGSGDRRRDSRQAGSLSQSVAVGAVRGRDRAASAVRRPPAPARHRCRPGISPAGGFPLLAAGDSRLPVSPSLRGFNIGAFLPSDSYDLKGNGAPLRIAWKERLLAASNFARSPRRTPPCNRSAIAGDGLPLRVADRLCRMDGHLGADVAGQAMAGRTP